MMIWFLINNIQKITQNENIASIKQDFSNQNNHKKFFKNLNYLQFTKHKRFYTDIIEKLINHIITKNIASEKELYNQPECISWDFIEKKSNNPLFSFESHGITHNPVIALTNEELEKEVINSKKRLFDVTGKEVNHFCYPYGGPLSIGKTAPKIIGKHFQSCTTMIRGRVNSSNVHYLSRIPIYDIDNDFRVLLKMLTY
jgi:Predicted xylanase/chitin deacetylase